MIKNFTEEMLQYFFEGQEQRKRLSLLRDKIVSMGQDDTKRHLYLYSEPGLGKTHTISNVLIKEKIPHLVITNNVSMWAFGVNLATINYLREDKEQPITVFVDDCSAIFNNQENINIMKVVLDKNGFFSYQKHLNLINQLNDVQQRAIRHHMTETEMGFKVNCNNINFIFASNVKLPIQIQMNMSQRNMDLFAIRDRCKVLDFSLKPLVQWGWIVDTAFNTNLINPLCPKEIIEESSIFMFNNWSSLKTKSIRTIKDLCDEYVLDKVNYKTIWKHEYIA
jgi:hypothetical protein